MARRPTMVLRSLAELRRAMQDAGYDTVSLAKKVKRSKSLTGYLFSGTRKSTGQETAHAIEDALDVPRGTLFYAPLSAESDNTGEDMDTLLTPGEVADRMGCSEKHVYRLIADGEFETTDISRTGSRKSKTRVPSGSLAEYMRRQAQPRPTRTAP
jgi:excisionase family DNA binding protein